MTDTAPPPLTAKDVLPLFKDVRVRVPRLKDGGVIRGQGGVIETEERALREADILSMKEDGRMVRIVTVDGRKLEASR